MNIFTAKFLISSVLFCGGLVSKLCPTLARQDCSQPDFSVHGISHARRLEYNMPANLENSAVAPGLEKVSFHSNPKERKRRRMLKLPHNCTHLTR